MSGPQKTDIFADIFPKVVQTIRSASALAAQDVNFYKSIDADLGKDMDNSSKSLLQITNRLLSSIGEDGSSIKYGQEEITGEASWKKISSSLDILYENIENAFDEQQQQKGKARTTEEKPMVHLEDGTSDSSAPNNRNDGKRIPKPQVQFRVPVDNSESHPFKPMITTKPHGLKTYEESTALINPAPTYEESIELVDPPYYAHPYEFEIDNQPYPEEILIHSEPIPSKDWVSTSATWVETVDDLNKMIDNLRDSTEIAVDLEHHDYRTYYGIVCLMQISNRDQDWIVDTLKLRNDLEPLNEIFTNPNIVKIFHGAFMDIIWLQRDLGLYIVSLFDTYHASKALGFPKFSLAYLLETFANFKTSKKYQLADWRIRPLSTPMLAYARSDTHFLLNIYDQLRNKLIDGGEEKLRKVLHDSRQVAKRRFEYTKYRPLSNNGNGKVSCPIMANNPAEPYSSIMVQYNLPIHRKPIVEVLYNWRDAIAKTEDESVRYVMPNQLLVDLSNLEDNVTTERILNASRFVSEHVRLNVKELAQLLETTIKRTAQNDWDLVDKWNEDPSSENINEIADNTTVLELINHNDQLLESKSDSSLLKAGSKLFTSIYEGAKSLISVECEPDSMTIIKHNFGDEYNERLKNAWKEMSSIHDEVKINLGNPIESEDEKDEVAEQVQEKKVESVSGSKTGSATLFADKNEFDPNEVITLRKKNFNQRNNTKKAIQSDEKAFDYANADKMLLEPTNSRDRKRENNKKRKPKFDPYSKESDGPQPSKRGKHMTVGKSSTFKDRRR
ncbi:ribosomal RNA processing 3'-5 [Scheffersomyces coipomensis]|uniref:ribosomal RNA processing 3'-5 n=1 Tax=Scheffersomyces coipomensis TaxID=1788519 RepID=UPI00315DBF26